MKRALHIVLFFGSVVAIWWVAAASGRWSAVILPSPASVADYLWSATLDGSLIDATLVTVRRLLVGYLIGVVIGLPLGLFTSRSQWLEDTLGSLALGLQTLPSVCWVPLALIW
ncbi:MAG: sulfonate transport system permease protein, partial [Alphaproteobacteria bacterium]|nr:sulfonate transport system permease protein [Alphaproteobacteria bacterium]